MDAVNCVVCKIKIAENMLRFHVLKRDNIIRKRLAHKIHQITGEDFESDESFICYTCRILLVEILDLEERFLKIFKDENIPVSNDNAGKNLLNNSEKAETMIKVAFEQKILPSMRVNDITEEKKIDRNEDPLITFEDEFLQGVDTLEEKLPYQERIEMSNKEVLYIQNNQKYETKMNNNNIACSSDLSTKRIVHQEYYKEESQCKTTTQKVIGFDKPNENLNVKENESKETFLNYLNKIETNKLEKNRQDHEKKVTKSESENKKDGEKAYECEKCPWSTNLKSSYFMHRRTKHPQNRPFKCTFCSYLSASNYNVRKHTEAVHMGYKPFQCPHCNFSAASKYEVKRHSASIHNN